MYGDDPRACVGIRNRTDAARIQAALIDGLPGAHYVDAAAVAAALPGHTTGSNIREIIRRAVLADDLGHLSTATLLTEVGCGRYRATVPEGMYL
jgi:cell division protease FtsH